MSSIRVTSCMTQGVTVVSNAFLDRFLPKANGEFIKIYLYFLRVSGQNADGLSLSAAADILNCTEKDVLRALRYWEKEGVLRLSTDENGDVSSIFIGSGADMAPDAEKKPTETAGTHEGQAAQPAETDTQNGAARTGAETDTLPSPDSITADRMMELSDEEDVRELMFIAQQYVGKTLSSTEARTLCYFYDGLHFSPDLIDFLIEYCVSHGHKSFRYMEKVALNWHSQGITTVHAARTSIESYHREYYDILKALGVEGRHPVDAEIRYMKKWLETWQFPMELILEACSRTVLKTQKPSLSYADGILSRWKKSGAMTMDAVRALDSEHAQEAGKKAASAQSASQNANTARKKNQSRPAAGSFSAFSQRSYDYDSLESSLLNK